MTDIGVSMRREVLEHKQQDGLRPKKVCYWNLRSAPARVERMWVASGGRWQGYFIIHQIAGTDLRFWSESWVERDGGPRKPFQGFTYKVPNLQTLREQEIQRVLDEAKSNEMRVKRW